MWQHSIHTLQERLLDQALFERMETGTCTKQEHEVRCKQSIKFSRRKTMNVFLCDLRDEMPSIFQIQERK